MKDRIKELYINGVTPTDIAQVLDITRATIYYHKNTDRDLDIDWDKLKLAKLQSSETTKESEDNLIATLILSFESNFAQLKEEEPQKALEIIAKYTNTYFKLKHPSNKDNKKARRSGAIDGIVAIRDLAVEKKDSAVLEFLKEHSENIISKIASN